MRAARGYTLLEVLVVLAIMALAVAFIAPRGEAMLDQMTARAVFFDFQRQVSDLRREAYASQTGVALRGSDDADPTLVKARAIPLRSGWTYRLTQPIVISDGGACAGGQVELLKYGRPVMHLAMADRACHFVRLD
jgi:prepilin-type N-terminal cleavage/methylation domain-containing protein